MKTINNLLVVLDETLTEAVIALADLLADAACTSLQALETARQRWPL